MYHPARNLALAISVILFSSLSIVKTHATPKVVFSSPLLFQLSSGQPIWTNFEGDIWSWNGPDQPLKQLTNWHYNYAPGLSPDGKWLTYLSWPKFEIDALANALSPETAFASNIWLINPATGNSTRISGQPENAAIDIRYFVSGMPVWSPDSNAFAWYEYIGTKDQALEYQIDIYDLRTKQTSTLISDAIRNFEGQGIPEVAIAWGKTGIAIADTSTTINDSSVNDRIRVYSQKGDLLTSVYFPPRLNVDTVCRYVPIVWTTINGIDQVSICMQGQNQPYFELFDPRNGSFSDFSGNFMLHSSANRAITNGHAVVFSGRNGTWLTANTKTFLAFSPEGTESVTAVPGSSTITLDEPGTKVDFDLPTDKNGLPYSINWLGWGPGVIDMSGS